jgi:hypothetical protein
LPRLALPFFSIGNLNPQFFALPIHLRVTFFFPHPTPPSPLSSFVTRTIYRRWTAHSPTTADKTLIPHRHLTLQHSCHCTALAGQSFPPRLSRASSSARLGAPPSALPSVTYTSAPSERLLHHAAPNSRSCACPMHFRHYSDQQSLVGPIGTFLACCLSVAIQRQ